MRHPQKNAVFSHQLSWPAPKASASRLSLFKQSDERVVVSLRLRRSWRGTGSCRDLCSRLCRVPAAVRAELDLVPARLPLLAPVERPLAVHTHCGGQSQGAELRRALSATQRTLAREVTLLAVLAVVVVGAHRHGRLHQRRPAPWRQRLAARRGQERPQSPRADAKQWRAEHAAGATCKVSA